jgi:formate dehydrogenase major subunit
MTLEMKIDGCTVGFDEGQTVLQVARAHGIYIPSLCYHRKTGPAGRCRMCLVQVDGVRGYQPACTTPARDGLVVDTHTTDIQEARRLIVNLLLDSGQHNCLSCESSGRCDLQEAAYHLGIEHPAFVVSDGSPVSDTSGVMIRRDLGKCIKCGRCVVACNHTVVNEVLDFGYRAHDVSVICDTDLSMGESSCVQCGECVQLCPVGALVDKKSIGKGRPWELESIDTTCPYCGVGCQVTLHVSKAANRIVRVTGREVPPNDGMLCVKGRYAFDFVASPERLTHPLMKRGGKQVPVSWDDALDFAATRLARLRDDYGPDSIAGIASSRDTNENAYAAMRFMRAVIGTNNIDNCART